VVCPELRVGRKKRFAIKMIFLTGERIRDKRKERPRSSNLWLEQWAVGCHLGEISMDSGVVSSGTSQLRLDTNMFVAPVLRRIRASFAAESLNPTSLWLVASEGTAAWIRYIESALGEHLDDRFRARAMITKACGEMYQRRSQAFASEIARMVDGSKDTELRAFFAALYPGPVGSSIRWSLEGLSKTAPGAGEVLQALQRVNKIPSKELWLEVSHHLGELAIVLTDLLPRENVPRAVGWLGDVSHTFGKEVAELIVSLFDLPKTMEGAIETLRMGEFLFRVNPEHKSGIDDEQKSGFIEGNACLWYERPGWKPVHCGVLGRFQAGTTGFFGYTYSLTQTIPKHGGDTCRISMAPVPVRLNLDRNKPAAETNQAPEWQPPKKINGRQRHRDTLAEMARDKNPVLGYYGPESIMWEPIRHSVILLGGGRAALMQLAHPAVAHAVRDHSVVHEDMLGRFIRTMTSAYTIIFGSIGDVQAVSERVFGIHADISGNLDDVPGQEMRRYHALDPEAVFWVGATLFDTAVMVYERMVRPLEVAERDRLLREASRFWAAFGLAPESCPTAWKDLRGYVDRRVESLAPLVGNTARDQASRLFKPSARFVGPIFEQLRLITAEMLPDSLRRALGMDLDAQQRMLARSWIFAAEKVEPWLPARLRYVPAYHEARRRMRQMRDR
jgi:uncharacterized protein (DUF2236 family)